MVITELNPKGNFDNWNKDKLKEIEEGNFSDDIGEILFENDELAFREIILKPKERLPFRIHKYDCSCTSFTDGLLLSRNINGRISLLRIEQKKCFYWTSGRDDMIHDLENISDNTVIIRIIEIRK
ncbi:hypothetical protein [Zobellia alginiliquefaciens]|uniref:hypothetical protein n=1 Tax=Zobellia alginiliquefaciens TaxID=3032586 RepID=UPI0023E3F436|nr:hypothetical protein [Zobellia alginiliquefaciens]